MSESQQKFWSELLLFGALGVVREWVFGFLTLCGLFLWL